MAKNLKRAAFVAAAVLAVVLAVRPAGAWSGHPGSDLFSWDQASRAEEAVRLAKEAEFLEAGRFIHHVLSLNWWPPLHTLVVFPFILVLGLTPTAVVLPSLVAFVLAILAILYCYSGLFAPAARGEAVGFAFLFGLAATSPLFLSSATWVMLEVFGTGLTFFGYGAYFRARRTGEARDYRLCGLLLFALWLTKYYYGMGFGLTLLVFETLRFRPRLRGVPSGTKVFRALVRPVLFPVYGLLALIAWIGVTGGGRVSLFGLSASLTGIYNPMTYLYLYATALGLLHVLKNRRRLAERLKPGQAALISWGVLPAALFMVLPDKIKAVIMNLEAGSRPPAPDLAARGLFYLRSFLRDHALFVPLGAVVLALALSAALRPRETPLGVRVLAVHCLFGGVSLVFGFNLMEGRYIATFVPALWMIAAWALASAASQFPSGVRTASAGAVAALAAGSILVSPYPVSRALEQPWAGWAHHEEAVRRPVESLVEMTRGARHVLMAGTRETGFGPLIGWRIESEHYRDKDFRLFLEDAGPGGMTTDDFRAMLISGARDRIVLCLVQGGTGQDRLREWARILACSGRYEKIGRALLKEPVAMRAIVYGINRVAKPEPGFRRREVRPRPLLRP
jgi:hypothetical protein